MDFSSTEHLLSATQSKQDLYTAIVNGPFKEQLFVTSLGLGIVVLLLVNNKSGTLDRIALSSNDLAAGAIKMSAKPFHEIKIPLTYKKNILIKAIDTGKHQQTENWANMFSPELTPQEARFNQSGAGIDCSVAYPLLDNENTPIGVMIFSYFEPLGQITNEHLDFMQSYANIASRALSKG
jgi:hypothetical protein